MQYLSSIISGILLIGFVYGTSISLSIGDNTLPPIAHFFSPFSGFWQNAELKKNKTKTIVIKDKNLKEDVDVLLDERNIPHIYANNLEDLYFSQGYITAKERLWQMDISIRSVEGRIAEVVGERALEADLKARQSAYRWAAENTLKEWKKNEEGMAYLDAYTAGINAYIAQLKPKHYPIEFKLLDYKPEKWSRIKTALLVKAMCKTLNMRHNDIANSNTLMALGQETFEFLYPDFNKKQRPIIQENFWNEVQTFNSIRAGIENPAYHEFEQEEFNPYLYGSNNWAVSGEKTKNGFPILANDPHLKMTLPAIWFENHLVAPGMNAYGVSLAGMPAIILGFNENIAWGQTNTGFDVFDYYKIKWVDENKTSYILDGEELEAEQKIERIKIKGAPDVLDTILYTYWGPVLKEKNGKEDLAQRWLSHKPSLPGEINVYTEINKAKDYNDFREALKSYFAPANNFVFASKDGDIAMHVTGSLPILEKEQNKFIQDGSTTKSEWDDYVPFEDMPHELNPSRSFVSSANQHPTDGSYPYYYSGPSFEDYRGRYIDQKLQEMDQVGTEEMKSLQLDAYSLLAEELLPIVLQNIQREKLSKQELEIYNSLSEWDKIFRSESKEATVFELVKNQFYKSVFDEIYSIRDTISVRMPEVFRLIELAEEDPENIWFDIEETKEKENLTDIINIAFKSIGFDSLELKNWNAYRSTKIDHLGLIPAFRKDNIKTDGANNTPNAISSSAGPSWRMVVELGDQIKAYGIYPGGQSGNPGSPDYDNFIEDWANGVYYELNNSADPDGINVKSSYKFKVK